VEDLAVLDRECTGADTRRYVIVPSALLTRPERYRTTASPACPFSCQSSTLQKNTLRDWCGGGSLLWGVR
jgi:hypothetical protein